MISWRGALTLLLRCDDDPLRWLCGGTEWRSEFSLLTGIDCVLLNEVWWMDTGGLEEGCWVNVWPVVLRRRAKALLIPSVIKFYNLLDPLKYWTINLQTLSAVSLPLSLFSANLMETGLRLFPTFCHFIQLNTVILKIYQKNIKISLLFALSS